MTERIRFSKRPDETSRPKGLSVHEGGAVDFRVLSDGSLRFHNSAHPTDHLGVRRGKEVPGTMKRKVKKLRRKIYFS